MKVACPQCRVEVEVTPEQLARGVARVSCEHCSFAFVIRLGDPSPADQKPTEKAPVVLVGVKSSQSTSATAGEIGSQQERFITADTQTSIKIDPLLLQEIEEKKSLREEKTLPEHVVEKPPIEAGATEAGATEAGATEAGAADEQDLPTPDEKPLVIASEVPTAKDPTQPDTAKGTSPLEDTERVNVSELSELSEEDLEEVESTEAEGIPVSSDSRLEENGAQSADEAEGTDGAKEKPTYPPLSPPAQAGPPTDMPPNSASGRANYAAGSPDQQPSFEAFRSGAAGAPPPTFSGGYHPAMLPPATIPASGASIAGPGNGGGPYPVGVQPGAYATSAPASGGWDAPFEVTHPPGPGSGMKVIGLIMTVLFTIITLLFFYVLFQNDWSLDLANFDTMLERAFGSQGPRDTDNLVRGLELTQPIIEEIKLASGARAILVKGAIKNNDTRPRRFLYVRAILKDNRDRTIVTDEAPADNVFTPEELAQLKKTQLMSHLNPAGRNGRNAQFAPGDTMAFMVVITDIPLNYSRHKHRITVEVGQVEFFEEP